MGSWKRLGAKSNAAVETDFSIADVNGGPARRTGIVPALGKLGVPAVLFEWFIVGPATGYEWVGNSILFSSRGHLFEVEIAPDLWKARARRWASSNRSAIPAENR